MMDFLSAALPWVVIGIVVAIVVVSFSVKKRKLNTKKQVNLVEVNEETPANKSEDKYDKKDKDDEENYMVMGLPLGMCFGTVLGAAGIIPLSYGISFGMLIGILVGMCIKKK